MITVLIVDDEPMLRMALKSIVPWRQMDCQVIGEAANGKEARELLDKMVPDILITDIKMPEMNGVELIRYIRENGMNTQILVLSGFDDFEFVREALVAGAVDYILKPSISEENLTAALKKAIALVQTEGQKKTDNRKLLEKEMLRDYLMQEEDCEQPDLKLDLLEEPYYVFCIRLWNSYKRGRLEKTSHETLFNAVTEIISLYYERNGYIIWNDLGEWIVFLSQKDFQQSEFMDIIQNIKLYVGLDAVVGVSSLGREKAEIKEKYRECREAVNYTFYKSEPVQYYCSKGFFQPIQEEFWKSDIPRALFGLIQAEEWEKIRQYELPFLKKKTVCHDPDRIRKYVLDYLIFMQSHLASKIGQGEKWFSSEELEAHLQKVNTWEEMKDFSYQSVNNFCLYVEKQLCQQYSPAVLYAIKYMEQHYQENVTLDVLAKETGMNAAYLSRLFVKEKGMSCVEYLTSVRILHAKELLKEKKLSVEEIAGMVGYVNSKYFFRVFKKATGLSPMQYRKRLWNLK